MIKIKGHEIELIAIKDAFSRKAVQLQNSIVKTLKQIGVKEEQIDIPLEILAIKKAKASATWYAHGRRMHYSYNLQKRFIDNLYIVFKIIELEVNSVISEKKTLTEFISEFEEEDDVDAKRDEAREFLGLEKDTQDFEAIDKRYKEMAKELHPDMPTGDIEKFKKLNKAHKTLKRELM